MTRKSKSPEETANKPTKAKRVAAKKAPPPKKAARKPGAPSIYTEKLTQTICAHIADGKSLRQIAAIPGMPSTTTITKWLNERPEFTAQYMRAREEQADKFAQEIVAIADENCVVVEHPDGPDGKAEVKFDSALVQHQKLRIDARKWVASKLAPKKYGDKIEIESAVTVRDVSDEKLLARLQAFGVGLQAIVPQAEGGDAG